MWYDKIDVSAMLRLQQGGVEVRVISGTAKGRPLRAVPGMNTRPTTDKVKEAIFSMIGPYFAGGMVLDLYAGTGGLAIEALSRGMDKAVLIDQDRKAVETIRDNIERAGFADRAEIYRNDAGKALSVMAKRGLVFDLVFLDPPYKLTNMDLVMFQLQEKQMLADGAIIVVEHDAKITYEPQIGDLIRSRCSEYGDTAVSIYRHQARVNTQTLE